MIRLGSLAGYPFEGPRLLAGWTPPAASAVYAILCQPDPDTGPNRYAVIYVGHSDDLSAERFPFRHPDAQLWVRRAGSRWKVYIAAYEVPGGGRPHREQIARELTAIYHPSCNAQQYGQSWKDEWIGREPEGRGTVWTEERGTSDEGRRCLKSAPEASGEHSEYSAPTTGPVARRDPDQSRPG